MPPDSKPLDVLRVSSGARMVAPASPRRSLAMVNPPRQRRVALVDSDALQRGCTSNSLNAMGVDHVPFEHLYGLVNAVREGHDFDVILLGLHADATREMELVSDVWDICRRRIPTFFLVHHTELHYAHDALSWSVSIGPHPSVILSPADDADLRAILSRAMEGPG